MVTHRLSYFSYAKKNFLLANSTCWPIIHHHFFYWPTQRVGLSFIIIFFTGQLNVLAYYTAARWISSAFALPHAREILLEMLAIDSNRKLDAIQFFEHVCIPRQHLINLVRPMPSWRPFTFLLYARATLALFSLIFSSDQSLSSVRSSTLSFIKASYSSADRSF